MCDLLTAAPRVRLGAQEQQIFANKYPDDAPNGESGGKGGFTKKISPTSFYPMMANASTDAQALAMTTHWLTNKTRFCINENYETENEGRCYCNDDSSPQSRITHHDFTQTVVHYLQRTQDRGPFTQGVFPRSLPMTRPSRPSATGGEIKPRDRSAQSQACSP